MTDKPSEMIKALQRISEIERMPALGDAVRLTNEALHLIVNGETVAVKSLKVRLEDIQEESVTLAFAFCDSKDRAIVNIGRYELRGVSSTLTIAHIANVLTFAVKN